MKFEMCITYMVQSLRIYKMTTYMYSNKYIFINISIKFMSINEKP